MFTGIVTDVGIVERVGALPKGRGFRIRSAYDASTIDIGASISCGGVCLTVTARGTDEEAGPGERADWFEVEAWDEALRLTTAGLWKTGDRINTERALKLGDELGGHLVSGHIDGLARIERIVEEGDAHRFVMQAPAELSRYIAQKGSVALDGTSLTVNAVEGTRFDVLLIRHSLAVTTWRDRAVGDAVNLEVDQIARYAERLFAATPAGR